MLDSQWEILLLKHMSKSPDKKFHVNELHACLNPKRRRYRYYDEKWGIKAIASLKRKRFIHETPTEIPLEKKYQITDKGVKAWNIKYRGFIYRILLCEKQKEFTVEDLWGFISYAIDQEMLVKLTNDIVKKNGIIRTVRSNDGELKYVITEKGQKERERSTRRILRKIARDTRNRERSKTVYIDEVGLGGQVVRSYSTSKKDLTRCIIAIVVFTVVAILAVILMT